MRSNLVCTCFAVIALMGATSVFGQRVSPRTVNPGMGNGSAPRPNPNPFSFPMQGSAQARSEASKPTIRNFPSQGSTMPNRTEPRSRVPTPNTQRNPTGDLIQGLIVGGLEAAIRAGNNPPPNTRNTQPQRNQPSRGNEWPGRQTTSNPPNTPFVPRTTNPTTVFPNNSFPSNPTPRNVFNEVPFSPPVVSVPSNVVPTPNVSVPRNSIPVQRTSAPSNRIFSGIPQKGLSLTGNQADEAVADLNDQINRDADEFDQSHNQADQAIQAFRDQINGPTSPLSNADKQAINAALDSKDPEQIRKALESAGSNPSFADFMAKAQGESNAKSDLLDAIRNGAGSDEIAARAQAFSDAQVAATNSAINVFGNINPLVAQSFIDASAQDLNDLIAKKSAAEAILDLQSQGPGLDNLANNLMTLPTSNVIATWLPQLPAGDFVAIDPQTVFIGTGPQGACFSGFVSPADAGFPIVDGTVVPNVSEDAPNTGEIVLHNPATNGASISYVLDSHVFTMEAAHTQRLPVKPWKIKFDRGGSFGESEKVLTVGSYEFQLTERGWDLVMKPMKVVIDNTKNPYDFSFVANQKVLTVGARDTLELNDPAQFDIRFDPGNGQTVRTQLDQGDYLVSVNPQSRLLELKLPERTFLASLTEDQEADPRTALFTGPALQKAMESKAPVPGSKALAFPMETPKIVDPPRRRKEIKVAKPPIPKVQPGRPVPALPPRS